MSNIPSHSDWTSFKSKYGIPKGAVSGINVGKELDGFHNGFEAGKFHANWVLAFQLETKLKDYLSKIQKTKVTKLTYDAFKKDFTTDYVKNATSAYQTLRSTYNVARVFMDRHDVCVERISKINLTMPYDPKKMIPWLKKEYLDSVKSMLKHVNLTGVDIKDVVQLWNGMATKIGQLKDKAPEKDVDNILWQLKATATKSEQLLGNKGIEVDG